MAKITIELDTNESHDDVRILRAVASAFGPANGDAAIEVERALAEAEPERTTQEQIAVGEQAAQRKRRTKAQIEADNAAQSATPASTTSESATAASTASVAETPGPQSSSPQPDAGTPTLAEINAMLRKLVNEHKQPILALQEVIKEATGGKHISQTEPGAEAFYGDIMAGLKALEEKATAHG